MRLSFKLATAYLKNQKERTLSLIISISLAVILVFALNVIPESKSEHDIKEAYKNFSDFHVEYKDIDLETITKIKNDKTVKEVNELINFGEIVSDKGVSISLNSYNKDFIEAYGYKYIKGNEPKGEDEIVIEEKSLKEMGLTNELNQNIDFNIIKKYLDKNSQNQIYSSSKSFKLVGIIKKPDAYYDDNSYKVKAFTYYSESQSIIPNELKTHTGVLKLNTDKSDMAMTNKIIQKYKLNPSKFIINYKLNEALEEYKMKKFTKFRINNKLIPMIASTLVIYNISNIILIDISKQIGMLRAIGMSKKKMRFIMFIKSLIVLFIGLSVGFLLGALISFIGINTIYNKKVNLYISKLSIIEPIIMALISVVVSFGFTIYKCGKISPMESIRSINVPNKKPKRRLHHKLIRMAFGITGEMAYKNLWRYKIRLILSILSISLAGSLFISKMAVYNRDDESIDDTSMIIMAMGDSDIILNHNNANSDENFNKYTNEQIRKIIDIDGVSETISSMNLSGYIKSDKDHISEDFKSHTLTNTDVKNIEVSSSIRGYDKKALEELQKYIESESSLDKEDSSVANAIVSNYFYSKQKSTNDATILKEIKVGDIIEVKIPTNKNGQLKYEDQKIRVAGLLNKDYVIKADGGSDSRFQVILDEVSFKELSGKQEVNKLSIKVDKGEDKEVISKIDKIINNNSFKKMESKYVNRNIYSDQNTNLQKVVLVIVLLTMVISSLNIVCIIMTNVMIRVKEISTLRAIGMSMKNINKMIIKESMIYGILSSLVASVVSTYENYKFFKLTNNLFSKGLGMENVSRFSMPVIEILEFFVAALLICAIAGYLATRKVKKLSIVQGLSNEE